MIFIMGSRRIRGFAAVLLLAGLLPICASATQVDLNSCQTLFLKVAPSGSEWPLKLYRKPSLDLPLVSGKEVSYSPESAWFSAYSRYEEVSLRLKKEDLKSVAAVLAQKGDPQPIEAFLQERLGDAAEKDISLSSVLPRFAKERTNTFCKSAGPNCRNATDNWNEYHGISPMRSSDLDFQFQMNYTRVKPGEELHFGDTLVIRRGQTIDHSAIYINENIIWHKASAEPEEPWTFESLQSALSYYGFDQPTHPNFSLEIYRFKYAPR